MENSKQTQLSLEQPTTMVKQQPWWFYPLAILCIFFIGGIAWAIAGDGHYTPETPAAEQIYHSWLDQQCAVEQKVAQANFDDIAHGIAINKDLNELRKKKDANCNPFIPQAKALSFETNPSEIPNSSILTFLPPNNDSNNNGHSDGASKHTDILPLVLHNVPVPQVDPSKALDLGKWKITRYYTPVSGQKRYFGGTFSSDLAVNCSGDCLDTANGYHLSDKDEYKVVACPRSMKLGTHLLIDGVGEVVCQDRGGAIKGKRLDIWAGVGDKGLDNIYARPETSGYHNVTLL